MPAWFWSNLRVQVFSPRTVQEGAGLSPSACTERESRGERRTGCAEVFESVLGCFSSGHDRRPIGYREKLAGIAWSLWLLRHWRTSHQLPLHCPQNHSTAERGRQ